MHQLPVLLKRHLHRFQYLAAGLVLTGGSAYVYLNYLKDGQSLPLSMKHHYVQVPLPHRTATPLTL